MSTSLKQKIAQAHAQENALRAQIGQLLEAIAALAPGKDKQSLNRKIRPLIDEYFGPKPKKAWRSSWTEVDWGGEQARCNELARLHRAAGNASQAKRYELDAKRANAARLKIIETKRAEVRKP